MTLKWLLGLMATCAVAGVFPASAEEATAADPRAEVAKKLTGAHADDLRASPIPGIYEYTRGTEIVYVTADGKYAISGDLYDLKANEDLTEAHRREVRLKMLATVPEDQMIIFGPKDAKYTVTVLTDVDCAYCRKLHSQIAEYNRLGVRVRYMPYPRTGPNTVSWTKAEQVWCSPDRNDAFTHAMLGQEPKAKACPNNPVAKSYAMGKDFSLEGTPSIVLTSGEMVDGYMPPDVLAQRLKEQTQHP